MRAVADGIGQPNGIAFSPDESIVYVTDTDAQWGNGNKSLARAATMYVFPRLETAPLYIWVKG